MIFLVLRIENYTLKCNCIIFKMYYVDKYFPISNIHGKNRNPSSFLCVFNVSAITRSGRYAVSAAGGRSPHQLVFKWLVGSGSLAGSYKTFREESHRWTP